MPTTDITRYRKFAEKKTVSVSAAEVKAADVDGTNIMEIFKLPPNAIATDAYAVVDTAMDAAITADLGFDGGAELGNNLVMDATGFKTGALVDNADHLLTETGKTVTAVFSAQPTVGEVHFVVEYTQYTLGNGNLTNYVA
jgi:hypothetical protein